MKGFVLWTLFGVFLYLAITAWSMGESAIMIVFGVVAFGCALAAPSGNASTKKKKKASAGR